MMVTITFPDHENEKRAIGILLRGFSGRILKSGEHIVPERALGVLAAKGVLFTVKGQSTYDQLTSVRAIDPDTV